MANDSIVIKGASEHNLKHIDLTLPRNALIVITGVSGSGKSSLAFDTLYAEGQRRYVESLSAYARQFLEQMEKPDVELIEGLSPAISIEQKTTSRNPRSTVGTVTEIYDYLRLLFARIGTPHCPTCGKGITAQTVQQIVDAVLALGEGMRIAVLAPIVRGRKGEYRKELADAAKKGFVRARVDGLLRDLGETITLDKQKKHTIEIVVDRIVVKPDVRGRLTDSVETALKLAEGLVGFTAEPPAEGLLSGKPTAAEAASAGAITAPRGGTAAIAGGTSLSRTSGAGTGASAGATSLSRASGAGAPSGGAAAGARGAGGTSGRRDLLFSEALACIDCGLSVPEITPRMFSFNSPYGACPACGGLGSKQEVDEAKIIEDPTKPLTEGALGIVGSATSAFFSTMFRTLLKHYKVKPTTPWKKLPADVRRVVMHGSGKKEFKFKWEGSRSEYRFTRSWEGVIPNFERRYKEASESQQEEFAKFLSFHPCLECKGARLRPESLAVKLQGENISYYTGLGVADAQKIFADLKLTAREEAIGHQVLKEIRERLGFLTSVGLGYLTLDRGAATLSGGEGQRIRLATQIGSRLTGVLYILDEPSIGLHQRDNGKLLDTLRAMRDLGNTVIVVEHDDETIRTADYVVDLGPGAGELGGEVVAQGTPDEIMKSERSLTGRYLSGELQIEIPKARRQTNGKALVIEGATAHNLKNITARFPLGLLTCVTGVSGSGKSTLVVDILYRSIAKELYGSSDEAGAHGRVTGIEHIDKIIDIDQTPIGRTPRSNPATYVGLFGPIRDLFALVPESRARGYQPGRFSFNVKGGRCEACQGDGLIRIEMHFLPDVYVTCDSCKGRRYNRETLEILYKGRNIADVLEMTVHQALELFEHVPVVARKLQTLYDVGLGYIRLGQSATTLSGGEAQRIKLAKELSKVETGRTLYVLDEPTTGLHFDDIKKLLAVLNRLADQGNTVIVIEHNLDVVKTADWVLDLGPEGGGEGGRIVAEGPPEDVARVEGSHTGDYLRRILKDAPTRPQREVPPAARAPFPPRKSERNGGRKRSAGARTS